MGDIDAKRDDIPFSTLTDQVPKFSSRWNPRNTKCNQKLSSLDALGWDMFTMPFAREPILVFFRIFSVTL